MVCLASTNKHAMAKKVASRRQSRRKEQVSQKTTIRYRPPVLYDREQEEADEETKLAAF